MVKNLTLADELATQAQSDSAGDRSSWQIAAPAQVMPLAVASGTTAVTIANLIAGQAYVTADLGQLSVLQTSPPYSTATGQAQWFGTPANQRGPFGIDVGFSVPTFDSMNGFEAIQVFGYRASNGWVKVDTYDILGWNSNDVILATGYNGVGNGYSTYLDLHTTTLKPGATNQTYPFTFGTDPGVTPALPPATTGLPPVPCYLAGTRVQTSRGMTAVEALSVGDLIRTVNGAGGFRPVVWIGRRELDASRHPEPTQIAPVRIRAGAFGAEQPVRDLLVSPDHAIYVDGALIPARLLINGGSIVQDMSIRAIRYLHVELDRHAVMLAEGLPAESYLAGTNRGAFADASGATELHPTFATDEAAYAARACAKLATDAAAVLPVWSRLAERGAALGMAPSLPAATAEPELRVVAGTRVLTPTTEEGRLVFALPPATKSVRLLSRSARPADTRPWLDDRRRLGVMVAGLSIQIGAGRTDVALDDAALADGWWAPEASDVGMVRWTDGNAVLALPPGAQTLDVRVAGEMAYPVESLAIAA